MSEPIKPALTQEEWEPILNPPPANVSDMFRAAWKAEHGVALPPMTAQQVIDGQMYDEISDEWGHAQAPDSFHRLAALALYGQPFGFTREMVSALRKLGEMAPDQAELWELADAAADRIEALLPPGFDTTTTQIFDVDVASLLPPK